MNCPYKGLHFTQLKTAIIVACFAFVCWQQFWNKAKKIYRGCCPNKYKNKSLFTNHRHKWLPMLNHGQEENRTPMGVSPPHFECGASTSFATRPWVQLHYYNLLLNDFAIVFDILCYLPNGQFLGPATQVLDG